MSNELKLVSPIPPSVNHYLGYRVIRVKKKNVVSSYPTEETKKYKQYFIPYIKNEVKKQKWKINNDKFQHYYVDWIVYFNRIDKDVANYDKVMMDTITESGVVWIDDNVVCNRVERIYYDSENPRIELTIRPVDYIGIFKDKNELNIFENKCKTCRRYKRNCSILKNAKIGIIQKDICNLECLKYKKSKSNN